jgi:hypothetical protein
MKTKPLILALVLGSLSLPAYSQVPYPSSSSQTFVTMGLSTGTVTSSSSQILAANTSRKYLQIQNTGNYNSYLNFGAAATTANLILPAGSTLTLDTVISRQALYSISPLGTTLVIVEGQ